MDDWIVDVERVIGQLMSGELQFAACHGMT
jgi:hypothetical protein